MCPGIFFTDWNLALSQMTSSSNLAIDDRKELLKRMHENKPIGIFSGQQVNYELEFFALQSVRSRMNLSLEEELTEDIIEKNAFKIEPVYLFVQENSVWRWPGVNEIIVKERFIKGSEDKSVVCWNSFCSTGREAIENFKKDKGKERISYFT